MSFIEAWPIWSQEPKLHLDLSHGWSGPSHLSCHCCLLGTQYREVRCWVQPGLDPSTWTCDLVRCPQSSAWFHAYPEGSDFGVSVHLQSIFAPAPLEITATSRSSSQFCCFAAYLQNFVVKSWSVIPGVTTTQLGLQASGQALSRLPK